jgi:hypothetical protein
VTNRSPRDRDRSQTLVRRDALGLLVFVLLLLWLAPALSRAQGADSLVMSWTAPGDDGDVGRAAVYELRIATFPLTAATFGSGLLVPGTPDPATAGSRETFVVRGLTRGTSYWLGIRTMDDAGNWSAVSNIVSFDWPPDAAPPAAPTGVSAEVLPGGTPSVRVSWGANAEADLAGYRVYRATAAAGPWQRVGSTLQAATEWTDTQLPAGSDALWYSVSAYDRSGGEGARSATSHVVLSSGLTAAPVAWDLQASYPNPARVGVTMRLPVAIPAGGGPARVELLDGAGRLVRRFELSGYPAGIRELAWDGTNDAGRPCAPGVYRAILVAPGRTRSIFVARVP